MIGFSHACDPRASKVGRERFGLTKRNGHTHGDTSVPIAHGLAPVIGATITVTSEPNKGSSFTVTVPSPADVRAAED